MQLDVPESFYTHRTLSTSFLRTHTITNIKLHLFTRVLNIQLFCILYLYRKTKWKIFFMTFSICNLLIQQRVNLLDTRSTDNNSHYKIMFMTARVCSRFILDTPIIGYMLFLLILSQIENGGAEQLQCIKFMNEPEMICRYSLKWVSMTKCCYNYEKEYFYCCPHREARRLEYATRVSGILIVAVLLIITIIFLCVFCTRCPVGRAIHKSRIINRRVEAEML